MVDTLIEKIQKYEAQLLQAVHLDMKLEVIDAISRKFEENIDQLVNIKPDNFTDAMAIVNCMLGLIDRIYDDVDLAKKYARMAAEKLDYIESSIDLFPANRTT